MHSAYRLMMTSMLALSILNGCADVDDSTVSSSEDLSEPSSITDVVTAKKSTDASAPARIETAKAGIDYPTDGPPSNNLNFNVLVLDTKRIRIGAVDAIEVAEAGVDYPTDGPPGLERSFSVFVEQSQRTAMPSFLRLQAPEAGIDYPTDTPAPAFKVLVWTNASGAKVRVPLPQVAQIERAVAGTDYPTDGGSDVRRDFFVTVRMDGKRLSM